MAVRIFIHTMGQIEPTEKKMEPSTFKRSFVTAIRLRWLRLALALPMLVNAGCTGLNARRGMSSNGVERVAYEYEKPGKVNGAPNPVPPAVRPTQSDSSVATPARVSPTPSSGEVVQVSFQDEIARSGTSCQACSPNVAACGPQADCGCQSACSCQHDGQRISDRQEYIHDGGDLDPWAGMKRDGSLAGLGITDTVAHYETEGGKVCVTPTNRVAIYAPRFGAIRKITGPMASNKATPTGRMLSPVIPHGQQTFDFASAAMTPVGPQSQETTSLIDAFEDKVKGRGIDMVLPPHRMTDVITPMLNLQFLREGIQRTEETTLLQEFCANARSWNSTESLEVFIDDRPVAVVRDVKQVQDFHVYEPPHGRCSLRICKAASHTAADSGDIIGFTIRFDNVGPTPIEKVVIVDNLSPRLEYIEESQECSLTPAPTFTVEPNEAGSMILRWELKEPLDPPKDGKPGAGGVIQFRCLVR